MCGEIIPVPNGLPPEILSFLTTLNSANRTLSEENSALRAMVAKAKREVYQSRVEMGFFFGIVTELRANLRVLLAQAERKAMQKVERIKPLWQLGGQWELFLSADQKQFLRMLRDSCSTSTKLLNRISLLQELDGSPTKEELSCQSVTELDRTLVQLQEQLAKFREDLNR